ncbi:hypothetical protein R69927_07811 [Paraburkholderia domus]|jgi:hypothetical protein|uniref:Uncharacterized protein n=1 Tax=Paraburkholderia domus TaxID=2793075 RepID=A0A9N8R5K2_9BURK|nr:hypothetical protein [Paraburkholderia domus]MBK5054608.1 hypothetical protein [Burkholderia sp. R-70006]MBK5066485.1 hypothetical protein [Burkholderia sp. R-70199]MBK5091834.1 hypothetical protein [Burkholderia sp. R-69927]MBK5118941.1 hypothetical protein [Burkholderia sp. R-69980]MBK5168104.1 hypothetical protein [Burkholderia sp. R-70211]MBK5183330.1 hypothetical protein [Burkholderia sp. R-69749]MCI0152371.1 hypothetical protein [Paraburkholderia sediminicola]
MEHNWPALIKAAALRIAGLKRYWKLISGFVYRVSLLAETREAKKIENMIKYLDGVSKTLTVLKKNGVPDEKIQELAIELNVPLIQANLEGMIIARKFVLAPTSPEASQNASSRDPSSDSSKPSSGDPPPPQAP